MYHSCFFVSLDFVNSHYFWTILSGYINMNGTLNLVRFEKFLSALSLREMDRFDDIYSDNKWLEGKTAKKKPKGKFNGKGGASAFETVITGTPGNSNVFISFDK